MSATDPRRRVDLAAAAVLLGTRVATRRRAPLLLGLELAGASPVCCSR